MKKYLKPELVTVEISEDVIAASYGTTTDGTFGVDFGKDIF